MNISELQDFVETSIPLIKEAGFVIRELNDQEVVVTGEKRLNHNHHNTVFGGSISTILILSSWLMVRRLLEDTFPEASIVIERQCTDFLVPVDGDFTARCARPLPRQVESMKYGLDKLKRGRIDLGAALFQDGSDHMAASFSGTFYCRLRL